MIDWITAGLLVVGTAFMFLSAVGLLRMPDLFTRMHAATKLPTLAMSCMLLAVAVHFRELAVTTRSLLGIAFFFLTVPVSAQRIGRAAHAIGIRLWEGSVRDDLRNRSAGPLAESEPAGGGPAALEP